MSLGDILSTRVLDQMAPHLTYLYCMDWGVPSALPDALFRCTKLRYLQMSRSAVTGALPRAFMGLKHLTDIHLWGTQMDADLDTQLETVKDIATLPCLTKCFCNFYQSAYLDRAHNEGWKGNSASACKEINEYVQQHNKR